MACQTFNLIFVITVVAMFFSSKETATTLNCYILSIAILFVFSTIKNEVYKLMKYLNKIVMW